MSLLDSSNDIDCVEIKPFHTTQKPTVESVVAERDARIADLQAQLARHDQVKELSKRFRREAADPDYVESASEGMENELLGTQVAPASKSINSSQGPVKVPLAKGVVKRGPRAKIRIMYDYGVSEKVIATELNRSIDYIGRVINNDARTPDALDEDYDHVDEDTKRLYPPRPGPRRSGPKFKKTREPDAAADDRAPKHRRTEPTISRSAWGNTADSDATRVGRPRGDSVSQGTESTVLQFLRSLEPSMERLFPKFEAESFDDEMLHAVTSWPEEDIDKLLKDLTQAGVMTTVQRFVVKKGIFALRGTP